MQPEETPKFVCDICGKVAKSNAGLSKHKVVHK